MHRIICLTVVLVFCTASFGQNLLINGSFDEPALPGGQCSHDTQPVTGWTGLANRNDTLYVPACPRDGDIAHASKQGWGNGDQSFSQAVTAGITPGTIYTLSGVWSAGHMDGFGFNVCTAELHDGDTAASPLISKAELRQGSGGSPWTAFSVNGAPTGAALTVVIRTANSGMTGFALHVDGVVLEPATCLNPPSVTTVSPDYGARGQVVNMTVTGSNFVAGSTSVKLSKTDSADIVATGVNVAAGGSSLTCSLDLTGATNGRWSVVVTVAGANCTPVSVNDAFLVVLPSLSNGSFELPTATGACPAAPIAGFPTDWLANEIAAYGYEWVLFRDSDRSPPTCPPPAGVHYASSISDNNGGAGAESWTHQTVSVTPGTNYTLFGRFAGGGNNTVSIELRDGDVAAALLGTSTVHSPGGQYDWTPAAVTGTPTGNYVTAVIRTKLNGAGPHAVHFDALSLLTCESPITVTGITPAIGLSNTTVSITDLAGTAFSTSGPTPEVILSKVGGGSLVSATNVTVVSETKITCDFATTGATSGVYDLMVIQGGCVGKLANALLMLGDSLLNGEFESPEAALNCGGLASPSTGWNFNDDRWRDHTSHQPTCPRLVPDATSHGHYQSMTTGTDRQLRDQQAWQSLSVIPGRVYKFAGYFAGGGANKVTIRLLDGGLDGTPVKETVVYSCTSDCTSYDWQYAEVSGLALSDAMTVVWELTDATTDASATHADGLTFASPCAAPWADMDADQDVDQSDFALLQACYTGGGTPADPPAYSPACVCLDRDGNGQINQSDVTQFEACASGPGVLANPECD